MKIENISSFKLNHNRVLQNRIKEKYFIKIDNFKKSNLRLNTDKVYHNNSIDLEQANSERKHNVLYSQIGLIGFSLMITLSIMYSIGGF